MLHRYYRLVRSYYHVEIRINGIVISNDAYVDCISYSEHTSYKGELKIVPRREDWLHLKKELGKIEDEFGTKIEWEVEVEDPLFEGQIYDEPKMLVGVEDYLFPDNFWQDRLQIGVSE